MAQKTNDAPREWYRINLQADPSVAEVYIFDEIGERVDFWTGEKSGVSAKSFLAEIQALSEAVRTIRVHVSSPGGNWSDATAIANLLRSQSRDKGRKVEVIVEALAASAATLITSAGDVIKVASNAVMMIHNASVYVRVIGDSHEIRRVADEALAFLDSVRVSVIATYRWVSKLSVEDIQALMDKTTWMNAEEAVAKGFATEIIEPIAATAAFDPRSVQALGEIPEPYRQRVAALAKTAEPAPEAPKSAEATAVLAACREAGCLELAEGLIAAGATVEQVTASIRQEQAARAARAEREKQIRTLCAIAKQPELADSYVAGGMPAEVVKAQLTIITAKQDRIEIDAHLQPGADGSAQRASLNPSAIWAERRARAGQRGV